MNIDSFLNLKSVCDSHHLWTCNRTKWNWCCHLDCFFKCLKWSNQIKCLKIPLSTTRFKWPM